jgi:hypothetical protein
VIRAVVGAFAKSCSGHSYTRRAQKQRYRIARRFWRSASDVSAAFTWIQHQKKIDKKRRVKRGPNGRRPRGGWLP